MRNGRLLSMSPAYLARAECFLRRTATEVPKDLELRRRLAQELFEAMYAEPGGVGIAAPMLGIGLSAVAVAPGDDEPVVLFNPRVVEEHGDRVEYVEANLCLAGFSAPVRRRADVGICGESMAGDALDISAHAWAARLYQHEIEILNGVFFTDHVSPIEHLSCSLPHELAVASATRAQSRPVPDGGRMTMHDFSVVTVSPRLLTLKESVLRSACKPVMFDDWTVDELLRLITEMYWLQHQLEGVGIAAPQVGMMLQLAVIDNQTDDPLVLINPNIVERSDETETGSEGCLSLPGYAGPVTRATHVTVRNFTLAGEETTLEAEGFLARIIQHEVDHLNGMLYADRLADGAELRRVDPETLASNAVSHLLEGS